ncbi:nucleolar protein [Lichtheimia corymbifera JMRC:FSU:9682]|uniref:Nucleolar protein n=1 Tax=Lichtheimia corymbifera JMRC:FSU:9682 TaxID=1263082 RepID=A0A068RT82_9FUNG|nr:nucleolar protein [Lichtheimia corymbifera JMRC:FSU:9682]
MDDSKSLTKALLKGDTTNVDSTLDNLFKSSAGPTKQATAPSPAAPLVAKKDISKLSKRKQKQALAERAEQAAIKARELSSLPPLKRKRKADVLETSEEKPEEEEEKKADSMSQERKVVDEKEKNERTVFVGNVPVACCEEKSKSRALKRAFATYGAIESMRFRSTAFSETLPRKAAFIAKKFHDNRSVTNAYIVYKTKESADKALAMNGQVFMEKHLRVDNAANPKPHDRKRSVFVGSLPFDAEEEELWKFFADCGAIDNVRLIRDKKTNIGKGIGYVQFTRRAAVDLALALDDKPLRDNHTLRIQRCKDQIPKPAAAVAAAATAEAAGRRLRKKEGSKATNATKGSKASGDKKARHRKALNVFEGARASKSTGNKFKIGKTSSNKKQKRH